MQLIQDPPGWRSNPKNPRIPRPWSCHQLFAVACDLGLVEWKNFYNTKNFWVRKWVVVDVRVRRSPCRPFRRGILSMRGLLCRLEQCIHKSHTCNVWFHGYVLLRLNWFSNMCLYNNMFSNMFGAYGFTLFLMFEVLLGWNDSGRYVYHLWRRWVLQHLLRLNIFVPSKTVPLDCPKLVTRVLRVLLAMPCRVDPWFGWVVLASQVDACMKKSDCTQVLADFAVESTEHSMNL